MLESAPNYGLRLRQAALAYGSRDAHERERQAGRTKLNYEHWLIARTTEFTLWFGDWLGLRAQKRLAAMEPTIVHVAENWSGLALDELRTEMGGALNQLSTTKAKVIHPELGEIGFNTRGKKKTNRYSADRAKVLTVLDILSVLPKSIYVRSEPPKLTTKDKNIRGVSILLAPTVEGTVLVARFVIHRKQDGHWYYDSVLLHTGKGSEVRVSNRRPDQEAGSGDAPILTSLGIFERSLLRRVKPDSVSGEIAPETGEPLAAAVEQFKAEQF